MTRSTGGITAQAMHGEGKRFRALSIIFVVVLSASVLYWRLPGRGILDGDSLVYFRNARTDVEISRWILAGKHYNLKERFEEKGIFADTTWYGKPVYRLLAMVSLSVLGERDDALLFMNAAFGVLSAVAIYGLAVAVANPQVALFASVFWITSPIFLWYGRSAMVHMPQFFFLLAGLAMYMRALGKDRPALLAGAGALLGLSLWTHLSTMPTLGLLFLYDFIRFLRREGFAAAMRRALLLASPVALLTFLLQAESLLFIRLLGPADELLLPPQAWRHMSVWDQFWLSFSYTHTAVTRLATETGPAKLLLLNILKSYVYDPWIIEGGPRLLAMIAAFVLWICRIRRDWQPARALLAILIAIPFGFYASGWSNPSMRTILTIFPLLAIPVGEMAERASRSWAPPVLRTLALSGIFLYLLHNMTPIYEARSGYKNAALWLKRQGVKQVGVLDTHDMGSSFMEAYGVRPLLFTGDHMISPADAKYVVVSERDTLFNPPKKEVTSSLALARDLLARGKPLFGDQYIPVEHAFELRRRRWSPLVDWLLIRLTGKAWRRNPFPVAIFDRKDLAEPRTPQ